jgi:hypothetical protein
MDDTSMDWVGPVINLVTTGGFGALLWYLVAKRMPEQEKTRREEREAADAAHRLEREDQERYHREDRAEHLSAFRDITEKFNDTADTWSINAIANSKDSSQKLDIIESKIDEVKQICVR